MLNSCGRITVCRTPQSPQQSWETSACQSYFSGQHFVGTATEREPQYRSKKNTAPQDQMHFLLIAPEFAVILGHLHLPISVPICLLIVVFRFLFYDQLYSVRFNKLFLYVLPIAIISCVRLLSTFTDCYCTTLPASVLDHY